MYNVYKIDYINNGSPFILLHGNNTKFACYTKTPTGNFVCKKVERNYNIDFGTLFFKEVLFSSEDIKSAMEYFDQFVVLDNV